MALQFHLTSVYFLLITTLSKLDHPGLAKLVAAHAKPPNYMYFFEFFESPNLSEKLHMEEWTPSIDQVLVIALHLGMT